MSTVTYQIDSAMLGSEWDGNVREFAQDLQREINARGWEIEVEAVNSYNGARNVDEDGNALEEQFPAEFDGLFWEVAERHNTR